MANLYFETKGPLTITYGQSAYFLAGCPCSFPDFSIPLIIVYTKINMPVHFTVQIVQFRTVVYCDVIIQ